MNWNKDVHRHALNDIEDLAYPPSGGRGKMVILGILLPAAIAYFAVNAWTSEEAIWFGRGSSDMTIKGDAARSMAITYLAVALFAHFRWFWGLLPSYRMFTVGIVLSMILGLGGCAGATYFMLV